jgi:hypothetical protein
LYFGAPCCNARLWSRQNNCQVADLVEEHAIADKVVATIAGRCRALLPIGDAEHWNQIHVAELPGNLSDNVIQLLGIIHELDLRVNGT